MLRLRRYLCVLLMLLLPWQAWAAISHVACAGMAQTSAIPGQARNIPQPAAAPDVDATAMMACHTADTLGNPAPDAEHAWDSGCQHCAACLLAPGLLTGNMPAFSAFAALYGGTADAVSFDFLPSVLDRPPRFNLD
jgi:hypothetical protein